MILIFLIFFFTGAPLIFLLNKYFSGQVYKGPMKNLKGKYAIITGGSSGIGRATALRLAKQGCHIIIGDIEKQGSLELIRKIEEKTGLQNVEYQYLNLGDLESIKKFVEDVHTDHVEYLINNAGVMGIPKKKTTESGYEMHCGINYIGHFYLTHLLWDKLQNATQYRIVNLSSITHKKVLGFLPPPHLNIDDLNFQKTPYSPHLAYSLSKLYCVLFTKALASEVSGTKKGLVVAVHPGIVRTNIIRYIAPSWKMVFMQIINPIYAIFTKSAEEGSETSIAMINMHRQKVENGGYYSDCELSDVNPDVRPENWTKLWHRTQRQLGIQFGHPQQLNKS